MGGGLSVSNSTESRIVVQLEHNPVSIRYWAYVEPGDTNRVWEHARGDPLNQGFFIMRVIDVESLPSPYQPPNMFAEQWKAIGFTVLGVLGLGATGIIGMSFLATGSPNWKSPQWQIPTGNTTQHREVWKPIRIGTNTRYNVVESNGQLLLEKVSCLTPLAAAAATFVAQHVTFMYTGLFFFKLGKDCQSITNTDSSLMCFSHS